MDKVILPLYEILQGSILGSGALNQQESSVIPLNPWSESYKKFWDKNKKLSENQNENQLSEEEDNPNPNETLIQGNQEDVKERAESIRRKHKEDIEKIKNQNSNWFNPEEEKTSEVQEPWYENYFQRKYDLSREEPEVQEILGGNDLRLEQQQPEEPEIVALLESQNFQDPANRTENFPRHTLNELGMNTANYISKLTTPELQAGLGVLGGIGQYFYNQYKQKQQLLPIIPSDNQLPSNFGLLPGEKHREWTPIETQQFNEYVRNVDIPADCKIIPYFQPDGSVVMKMICTGENRGIHNHKHKL